MSKASEFENLIPVTGSYIVSWDISFGKEDSILLVGKKEPGERMAIVNAITGSEAEELVKRLSTQVPKTSISSQVDKMLSITESLKGE